MSKHRRPSAAADGHGARTGSPTAAPDDVLETSKPTEHRLAQHANQAMATVAARAAFDQMLTWDVYQTERVIELAMGQQACIGGDAGAVELQFEAAQTL